MIKKTGIAVLIILISSFVSQAQLYDKVWVVSDPGYTFTFDSIDVRSDSLTHQILDRDSWSSICDESGNLEFFTNGVGVFTKASRNNNDGIYNSQDITDASFAAGFSYGTPSQHANLIFPRGNRKYYLVCQSVSDSQMAQTYIPDNLYYAEVDMNANSGLGAVTSKKNLLYHGLLTKELFTACKHGNGRDYWLVLHSYLGGADSTYIKYLVTPDTILGPFFQNIGGVYGYPIVGQIAFSADGSRMAGVTAQSQLNILDFDRCSGIFSHSILLDIPIDTIYYDSTRTSLEDVTGQGGISVSFSPSGRYLYFNNKYEIYQYDLQSVDIAGTRKRIYLWKLADGGAELGDGYLAPNGQIILADWNSTVNSIKTILYPNPASEMVQLDLYTRDLSESLCFVVYDMIGQEILRRSIPLYSIQIQRGSIVTGVYNWQIQNNKGQIRANGKLVWD